MILLLGGCSEFALHTPPPTPPADPPADASDAFGDPPDWSTCSAGWLGEYFNLPGDHPDIEPAAVPTDMAGRDWWDADRLAFERFDASLDEGANWWPVDEGLDGDPAYFAARWTAWLRVTDAGTLQVVLGAQTVAWLLVNGEEVATAAAVPGEDLVAGTVDVAVTPGQFPLDLRFGQLYADRSGFRFRVVSGDALLCYPDFSGR